MHTELQNEITKFSQFISQFLRDTLTKALIFEYFWYCLLDTFCTNIEGHTWPMNWWVMAIMQADGCLQTRKYQNTTEKIYVFFQVFPHHPTHPTIHRHKHTNIVLSLIVCAPLSCSTFSALAFDVFPLAHAVRRLTTGKHYLSLSFPISTG